MSSEDPTQRSVFPGETSRLDLESQPTQVTEGSSRRGTPAQLVIGSRIANRYTVRSALGVGGMGEVYRVYDEVLGIDLALKMLRSEIAHDEEFLERFRNELIIARQVTHRNVVRIHDIGDHQGLYFMTMDLVEGRSLREILQEQGRLDLDQALPIVRQIAAALAEAHRCGVVHRDLKPANILIDHQGDAYITDFGIARSLTGPALTRTGEVLGTPDYLSPEQARGEKVDGRSDLYSLGLMLVEMLSGKLPFPGGTLFEVLAQRMSAQVPNLDELGINVPAAYAAIIERCTSPDPATRYASADELMADLGDLRRPAALLRRRRLARVARWSGVALLAALAVLGAHRLLRPVLAPDRSVEPVALEPPPTIVDEAPPPIPPATHALLVLPVGGVEAGSVLDGLKLGLAGLLAEELAHCPELRVVDPAQVLAALTDLDIEVDRLRSDQLAQLADLFQVDRVVVPKLGAGLELTLFDATQPDQPAEVVATLEGGAAEVVAGLAASVGVLGQALGLPAQGSEGAWSGEAPSSETLLAEALGADLLLGGRAEEAIIELERAVASDAGSADALLRLARAYTLAGRADDALDTAEQAVVAAGTEPDEPTALWASAEAALLRGAAGEAMLPLGRLVALYPYDSGARLTLADACGQQGDFAAAVDELRRAVALDETNSRAWYLLGRYAIGLGEIQTAVDDYLVRALILRRSLRDAAGQAEVHNALGVGYQRLGRLDQAIESYGEAVEIRRRLGDRGDLAKTLHNLGWIQLAKGQLDTAEESFRQALELHTELDDAAGVATLHNAFGSLEEVRGREREALEHYRRALQIRDELGNEQALAESHNNVGFAYSQLGEPDNALLHLERALAILRRLEQPPGIVQTLQNIGFARLALGRWPAALEAFDEALPIARQIGAKTEIAVSLGNQGLIAQLQGRYGVALAALGEARAIVSELGDPRGQVEFALFEAEARLELGDADGVIALLDALEPLAAGEGIGLAQRARLALLRARWQLATASRGGPPAATSLDELLSRAQELAVASQDPAVGLEVESCLAQAELAGGEVAAALARLRPAVTVAERLGNLALRLQLAEQLARAELASGAGDPAETLRSVLRLTKPAGGYAGAWRLQRLLAQTLDAAGDSAAAQRAVKNAETELERLRGELGEGPLRDAFETLVAAS